MRWPKSKPHLPKKRTTSDFQFQLTMKLWDGQKVNYIWLKSKQCLIFNSNLPWNWLQPKFAQTKFARPLLSQTQVCPTQHQVYLDPNLPEAKFAQTQVCPGQICPDPYLPKPNSPRAKFALKEIYVSKNQENCQISMN